MPVTRNAQIVQMEINDRWSVRYSIINCRHVGSDPSRIWSQHAASEPQYRYRSNALDVFASVAVMDEIAAYLRLHRRRLNIRQVLYRIASHFNHIHVDCWPKMQDDPEYVPPCKGGTLEVINKDGTHGHTFGPPPDTAPPPPPPPNEEDEVMIKEALQAQTMAWYESLQDQTGSPGGNASYWGVDYVPPSGQAGPTDEEWDDALPEIYEASLTAGVLHPSSDVVDEVARKAAGEAWNEASRANTRLDDV